MEGGFWLPSTIKQQTMTEYELEKLCESQTECGCNCIKCELFARYIRTQGG